MKFTLNQRRSIDKTVNTQTTSEFLQQDRFAGVAHETIAADPEPTDPRTPKRVLDELDITDTPQFESERKNKAQRANEESLSPSPAKQNPIPSSPTRLIQNFNPLPSDEPQVDKKIPSDPNETVFDIQPEAVPATDEGVISQGLEISALHTKHERKRGFRKRGHVAFTQYTYNPGQGIHHTNFVQQLYAGSPVEHYTQILIWCLNARIIGLKKSGDFNATNQAAIKALHTLIYELARGSNLSMNWTRQTHKSLPESERASNPVNEQNRKKIDVLKRFLKDLQQENKEWMTILKESEEKEIESETKTENVVSATLELPEVRIDEGLKSICAKVAQLGIDVDEAQEQLQQYISQLSYISQNPTLLNALNI